MSWDGIRKRHSFPAANMLKLPASQGLIAYEFSHFKPSSQALVLASIPEISRGRLEIGHEQILLKFSLSPIREFLIVACTRKVRRRRPAAVSAGASAATRFFALGGIGPLSSLLAAVRWHSLTMPAEQRGCDHPIVDPQRRTPPAAAVSLGASGVWAARAPGSGVAFAFGFPFAFARGRGGVCGAGNSGSSPRS